jgi:hypothetical protein
LSDDVPVTVPVTMPGGGGVGSIASRLTITYL